MHNKELIMMTKEIVIAMASTSNQYHANEDSAKELVRAMDIIYNKLKDLSENERIIYPKN